MVLVAHSDIAYLIDATGHTRTVLSTNPITGSAGRSSFVDLLQSQLQHLLTS